VGGRRLIDLTAPAAVVAPRLLGATIRRGDVAVRLTEVEAYAGESDPASHASRGRTRRNEVMYGQAGALYVYFVYGMHWCANIVTGPEGMASAVLLRGGQVTVGLDIARTRRPGITDRDLARGPARLASALGLTGTDTGQPADLVYVPPPPPPPSLVRCGPRVGVAAATDVPWRFWIDGDPTVSRYRPWTPRRRRVAEASEPSTG
jgi:DNA-3-methyladenine glycosylase